MAPPVVEMKTNLAMSPLGVSCAHRLPTTRISRKRIQSSGPRCFEYKMESAKRKAEPTTLENNEALPRKRARTQIYRTAYTTQWPCIVPASNGSSCYAHCTFCDEDFSIGHGGGNDIRRHVESNKHKANGQHRKQNFAITKFFAASSSTQPADGRTVGVTRAEPEVMMRSLWNTIYLWLPPIR